MSSIYEQLNEACRQFGMNAGEALKEASDLIATNGKRERVMDRKKYIVEASDDVKKVIALGVTHGGAIWTDTTDIENLEELNSDYINEHFSELQDDAYERGHGIGYQKGYDAGIIASSFVDKSDEAYQKGLNDAWEAAKKILQMYDFTVFGLGHDGVFESPLNEGQQMTPQEAIEKLKAYEEQKADDEIKVGDEVVWTEDEDTVIIVTLIYTSSGIEWCDGICRDGKVYQIITEHARKTGKHFDIDKILEEMKE